MGLGRMPTGTTAANWRTAECTRRLYQAGRPRVRVGLRWCVCRLCRRLALRAGVHVRLAYRSRLLRLRVRGYSPTACA